MWPRAALISRLVTHVINYDVPTSPDTYVHRSGAPVAWGAPGRAITFVESRQKRELEAIERHIGTKIAAWSKGRAGAAHAREGAPAPALKSPTSRATRPSPRPSWCSAVGGPRACA